VRRHWAAENSLHWLIDMVFRDNGCRVRTQHAPANLTTLKLVALNLLQQVSSRDSLRARRKAAAYTNDFLPGLIVS
jgi:predicted transposase YbfD/YdcC